MEVTGVGGLKWKKLLEIPCLVAIETMAHGISAACIVCVNSLTERKIVPNYNFKCVNQGCKHEFQQQMLIAKRDDPVFCPDCGEVSKRLVTCCLFSFAEGDRPMSSRPDRYWDNAEEVKQKKIKEEQEKVTEQSFYNDPKCPDKYKNVADELK